MTPRPHANQDISVDVLIVGAGFSGLCMGIKLLEAGMKDFLIIEKSSEIGGTWWENRYPGCACDVPSHLYSFSFERNPDWTRMFASAPEIHEYLKSCVQCYGLAPYIRLKTRFQEAAWDEAESAWHVRVGENLRIRARVIVSGVGALHVPRYPEIPGLEQFGGPAFHSATWKRDCAPTTRPIPFRRNPAASWPTTCAACILPRRIRRRKTCSRKISPRSRFS